MREGAHSTLGGMTSLDPVPATPPADSASTPPSRRPRPGRRLVAGIGAGALVVGLLVGGGAGFAIGEASGAAAATSGTMPDLGGGTAPQMGGNRPDFGEGTPPQRGEGSPDDGSGGGTDGTTDESGTSS